MDDRQDTSAEGNKQQTETQNLKDLTETQNLKDLENVKDPKSRYWSGAHTRHRLLVHLVWIPKYRRRVLQKNVVARLEALLQQAAEVNRWQVHELAIQPDHIHLLLQIHPRQSIASVVKTLKEGTSRVLRSDFPELEEFLWGDSFWADGYFAETIGRVNEEVVSDYIRRQGR